jgi:Icc-related predicted phosphoesterase
LHCSEDKEQHDSLMSSSLKGASGRPVTAGRRVSMIAGGLDASPPSSSLSDSTDEHSGSRFIPDLSQAHPSFSGILAHASRNVPVRALWRTLRETGKVQCVPVDQPPVVTGPSGDTRRLVIISDTHNRHRTLDLPAGDLLIHCGDFTDSGHKAEITDFCNWLREVAPTYPMGVLVVAGNHEYSLDAECYFGQLRQELKHEEAFSTSELEAMLAGVATYARHGVVEMAGMRIFTSPRTPGNGWAFAYSRPDGHEVWRNASDAFAAAAVDVLVTHGPPLGHGDRVPGLGVIGCADLLDLVEAHPPTLHCFGHVHNGRGMSTNGRTLFVNAANADNTGSTGDADDDGELPTAPRCLRPATVVDIPLRGSALHREWQAALAQAAQTA